LTVGKRSDFERKENDAYFTPYEAVPPLLPFLKPKTRFIEPCAGDGRLIRHLERHGHKCVYACDIAPQGPKIEKLDCFTLFPGSLFTAKKKLPRHNMIITNSPWEREPLHRMIEVFTEHADTWLLFDADWKHTVQAKPYRDLCKMVVSVGRVSWEGNGVGGKDNAAWYLFSKKPGPTIFVFRA
jgi:hypothetical protein